MLQEGITAWRSDVPANRRASSCFVYFNPPFSPQALERCRAIFLSPQRHNDMGVNPRLKRPACHAANGAAVRRSRPQLSIWPPKVRVFRAPAKSTTSQSRGRPRAKDSCFVSNKVSCPPYSVLCHLQSHIY